MLPAGWKYKIRKTCNGKWIMIRVNILRLNLFILHQHCYLQRIIWKMIHQFHRTIFRINLLMHALYRGTRFWLAFQDVLGELEKYKQIFLWVKSAVLRKFDGTLDRRDVEECGKCERLKTLVVSLAIIILFFKCIQIIIVLVRNLLENCSIA